jgi:hypothetical protein
MKNKFVRVVNVRSLAWQNNPKIKTHSKRKKNEEIITPIILHAAQESMEKHGDTNCNLLPWEKGHNAQEKKNGGGRWGIPWTTIFGILSICFVCTLGHSFLFQSFHPTALAGGLIMFKGVLQGSHRGCVCQWTHPFSYTQMVGCKPEAECLEFGPLFTMGG